VSPTSSCADDSARCILPLLLCATHTAFHTFSSLNAEALLSPLAAGTPFEGGVFRMKLVLGPDFPASPPKGKEFGL
jgi:hypothetical protein